MAQGFSAFSLEVIYYTTTPLYYIILFYLLWSISLSHPSHFYLNLLVLLDSMVWHRPLAQTCHRLLMAQTLISYKYRLRVAEFISSGYAWRKNKIK